MNPDDQKIRNIVREEMSRSEGNSRYQLKSVTNHIHNGVDSKPIYSPTIVYTGAIPIGAGAVLQDHFLPVGWSWELDPSGFYTITHNLNTRLYSVVVSKNDASGGGIISRVSTGDNQFFVFWYNAALALSNAGFFFTLVQINNKRSPLVQYADNFINV